MVEVIKPSITILQDTEYYLLFTGAMLFIFLLVTLYFSRYIYKKKYNVITKQPLDSKSTGLSDNGNENKPIVLSNGLESCTKGYCSMDLETGIKRCPEDPQGIVFFNNKSEKCVSKNKCIDPLKYAVNSDGSVNKNGVCETGLDGCRCTSNVTCPVYVTTKFSVANGNLFSTFSSDKNYIINQIPYTKRNDYQGGIKLNNFGEYCKLNSTYTSKIIDGCSFTNSTSDFLMDCDKESLYDNRSVSPYSLVPYSITDVKKQFCEVQPDDDSNWNNMTLCMSKNVCKDGNLTYNYDIYRKNSKFSQIPNSSAGTEQVSNTKVTNFLDSRRFCQSNASDLKTYLTDLRYYTLSCIKGTKCNQLPKSVDIGKFFVGNNSEFDPTAILNTLEITITKIENEDLYRLSYTKSISLGYDPLKKTLKNGDLISFRDSIGTKKYYMVRNSNTSKLRTELWDFTNNAPTKYTDSLSQKLGTYYSQFGLNGFGYNVVDNVVGGLTIPPTNGTYTNTIINKPIPYQYSELTITSYKVGNVYNTPVIFTDQNNLPLSVPSGTENSYTPLFSIVKDNTFFRGGLSEPQGYVIQNDIIEDQVDRDIEEENGILSDEWKIRKTPFDTSLYNNISMYYSVWNNNYGRTECIRCGPLLVASVNMARIAGNNVNTAYRYDAVTIQYSGKDFGHYRKDFINNRWLFTSTSTTSNVPRKQSKTNKLNLKRPNFNINIGDFVMSDNSYYDYDIKPLKQLDPHFNNLPCIIFIGEVSINDNGQINSDKGLFSTIQYNQFSPFDNYDPPPSSPDTPMGMSTSIIQPKSITGFGIDNNFYEDYRYGQHIEAVYNYEQNKFLFNKQNVNFLFGNKYRVVFNQQYYKFVTDIHFDSTMGFLIPSESIIGDEYYSFQVGIFPKTRVTGIDNTRRLINTDSDSNITIPPNIKLQFISEDRLLELENDPSVVMPFNTVGSGAKIVVDQITDGRITSIAVEEPGNGYTNLSPKVMFKSYDQYLLNDTDSNYQNKYN